METITLTDYETNREPVCEHHTGWPVHLPTECDRLAGVRPFTRNVHCSICDLEWDERVLQSQHLNCRSLPSGTAGQPQLTYRRAGDPVAIEYQPA